VVSDIEKRLYNTEIALMSLWHLMADTMPPAYEEAITRMMNDYFDANKNLGSEFIIQNGFIKKEDFTANRNYRTDNQ